MPLFSHPNENFDVKADTRRNVVVMVVQDVGAQHRRVLLTAEGARHSAQQLQAGAAMIEQAARPD
jgi:hypothetical protein